MPYLASSLWIGATENGELRFRRIWRPRFSYRCSLALRGLFLAFLLGISSLPGFAQNIVLEPVGPPQGLPIGPDVNRPPLTFLPARGRPSAAGPLKTWKAMRDEGVVRQAYDFSCGSAALATLLEAAGDSTDEREILRTVFEGLDAEARAKTMTDGLTLLDLQRASRELGYRAEGYRVEPEILSRLDRPVIVYIEPYGYRHFAVLRGIRGDRVFLADPARGNVRMPIWRFLDMWQDADGRGVLFVVGVGPDSKLTLRDDVDPQPELLSARQLIRLGGPSFHRVDSPVRFELE
jgi:predicted double-glycine peptidase